MSVGSRLNMSGQSDAVELGSFSLLSKYDTPPKIDTIMRKPDCQPIKPGSYYNVFEMQTPD